MIKRLSMWLFLAAAVAFCGCAETGNTTADGSRSAKNSDASDEVLNPTADQLHELAGEILLYITMHNHLPQRLEELQSAGNPRLQKLLIDPATGQSFVYAPESTRLEPLRGRVLVCQNKMDATGRRWALLINEQNHEGRMLMAVQHITEAQWKASVMGK